MLAALLIGAIIPGVCVDLPLCFAIGWCCVREAEPLFFQYFVSAAAMLVFMPHWVLAAYSGRRLFSRGHKKSPGKASHVSKTKSLVKDLLSQVVCCFFVSGAHLWETTSTTTSFRIVAAPRSSAFARIIDYAERGFITAVCAMANSVIPPFYLPPGVYHTR